MPTWMTDTLQRLRPNITTDVRGNQIPDLTDVAPVPLHGWSVQPAGTVEDRDHREAVRTGLRAYGPLDADLKAGDVVSWQGDQYRVVGAPDQWRSPFGGASHLEVSLERWEG